MKKIFISTLVLSFLAISCASSDSAVPEESAAADNDKIQTSDTNSDQNIESDNDSSLTGNESDVPSDNENTNSDTNTQPDNGTANPDTNPQPDNEPTPVKPTCGDGKIEGFEICEGDTPCSNLKGMTGGTIKCADDCRSADVSECTITAQKYGEISLNIDINYDPTNSPGATDPMKGFADGRKTDNAYFASFKQKKSKKIGEMAPMDGWFKDDDPRHTIPYSNPDDIAGTPGQMEIMPIHYFYDNNDLSEGLLEISQYPYKIGANGGMNNLLKNPIVTVYVNNHHIQPGDYSTGFGIADIYVFKYPETADSTETPCIVALAFDIEKRFKVLMTNNLIQPEGGEIEITADRIPLYHPAETPMGDLTSSFQNGWGLRICDDSDF